MCVKHFDGFRYSNWQHLKNKNKTLSVISDIKGLKGNVLFNDALNTFYLQLYGIRHVVKDHSDSEIGNLLPPHGLLFSINSKGSFICTIPDRIAHTTACYTSRGALVETRNSSMGPLHEGLIRRPIAP